VRITDKFCSCEFLCREIWCSGKQKNYLPTLRCFIDAVQECDARMLLYDATLVSK